MDERDEDALESAVASIQGYRTMSSGSPTSTRRSSLQHRSSINSDQLRPSSVSDQPSVRLPSSGLLPAHVSSLHSSRSSASLRSSRASSIHTPSRPSSPSPHPTADRPFDHPQLFGSPLTISQLNTPELHRSPGKLLGARYLAGLVPSPLISTPSRARPTASADRHVVDDSRSGTEERQRKRRVVKNTPDRQKLGTPVARKHGGIGADTSPSHTGREYQHDRAYEEVTADELYLLSTPTPLRHQPPRFQQNVFSAENKHSNPLGSPAIPSGNFTRSLAQPPLAPEGHDESDDTPPAVPLSFPLSGPFSLEVPPQTTTPSSLFSPSTNQASRQSQTTVAAASTVSSSKPRGLSASPAEQPINPFKPNRRIRSVSRNARRPAKPDSPPARPILPPQFGPLPTATIMRSSSLPFAGPFSSALSAAPTPPSPPPVVTDEDLSPTKRDDEDANEVLQEEEELTPKQDGGNIPSIGLPAGPLPPAPSIDGPSSWLPTDRRPSSSSSTAPRPSSSSTSSPLASEEEQRLLAIRYPSSISSRSSTVTDNRTSAASSVVSSLRPSFPSFLSPASPRSSSSSVPSSRPSDSPTLLSAPQTAAAATKAALRAYEFYKNQSLPFPPPPPPACFLATYPDFRLSRPSVDSRKSPDLPLPASSPPPSNRTTNPRAPLPSSVSRSSPHHHPADDPPQLEYDSDRAPPPLFLLPRSSPAAPDNTAASPTGSFNISANDPEHFFSSSSPESVSAAPSPPRSPRPPGGTPPRRRSSAAGGEDVQRMSARMSERMSASPSTPVFLQPLSPPDGLSVTARTDKRSEEVFYSAAPTPSPTTPQDVQRPLSVTSSAVSRTEPSDQVQHRNGHSYPPPHSDYTDIHPPRAGGQPPSPPSTTQTKAEAAAASTYFPISSLEWSRLNQSLRRQGHTPQPYLQIAEHGDSVGLDPCGLVDALFAVLDKSDRKERRLMELHHTVASHSSTSAKTEFLVSKNQSLQVEVEKLREAAGRASGGGGATEAEGRQSVSWQARCTKLEKENADLTRRFKVQDHMNKMKVKEYTKLQSQLEKLCNQEESLKDRTRQAVSQVLRKQQRTPLDVKILEVAQNYQRKMESLENDNNSLTLQNRSLLLKLTESDDKLYIQQQVEAYFPSQTTRKSAPVQPAFRRTPSPSGAQPAPGVVGSEAGGQCRSVPQWFIDNLKEDLENTKRNNTLAEEEINRLKGLNAEEGKLMQSQVKQLEGNVQMLQYELETRPSHAEHKNLQAELRDLRKASSSPTADGADRQLCDPRELIRRDRRVFHLGLHHVQNMDSALLASIVQDACCAAGVSNPHNLAVTVEKLERSMSRELPALDDFAKEVCMATSKEEVTEAAKLKALRVIAAWKATIETCNTMEEFFRRLQCQLDARPGGFRHPPLAILPPDLTAGHKRPSPVPTAAQSTYLAAVEQLVNLENLIYSNQQAYGDAENFLKIEPEQVLSRIVSHFMKMFEVPELQGCAAAISRIYAMTQSQQTFFKSLCAMLNLKAEETTFQTCERAVRSLFQNSRVRQDAPPLPTSRSLPGGFSILTSSDGQDSAADLSGSLSLSAATSPSLHRDMETLRKIMDRLGFSSSQGLYEDVERLVSLASQQAAEHIVVGSIMKALHVNSVADVMPALELMLRDCLSAHDMQKNFFSAISASTGSASRASGDLLISSNHL
eukprot:GHVS01028873.1.p1 GENE.GHVS01028873.1~~GHVS01028873.1.p1  ORF type:complete len:1675 (+),score=329.82 GHVS01028873.1:130-5154(+)